MRTARVFLASILVGGALITATVVAPLGAAPAQAASLPLQGEASAFVNSTFFWNFNAPPPGANQPCRPSAAHPYPVILTEGTFSSMGNSFGAISPDLVNKGYCVYAFNYGQRLPLTGIYATGDIAASARQLASEVSQVLNQTGASKVDIVGWSEPCLSRQDTRIGEPRGRSAGAKSSSPPASYTVATAQTATAAPVTATLPSRHR